MTSARTSAVRLVGFQVAPASMLLKTPPPVPVYTIVASRGSTAIALTFRLVSPELLGAQLRPVSVLLNRPLPAVPAYTVEGLLLTTLNAVTTPPSGPIGVQTSMPASAAPAHVAAIASAARKRESACRP